MNINDLKQLKKDLKELEISKEELKNRKELFDRKNRDLNDHIQDLIERVKQNKERIKLCALEEYESDPKKNKKLLGGIGIREKKVLSYDEKKAFDWALKTRTCLILDKKTFEKVGPTMVDFVEVTKEPSVTFPKVIKLED